mgnify:FL=1
MIIAVGGAWLFPQAAVALSILVALAFAGALVALIVAAVRPVGDLQAARAIDAHFGLPDQALSASELTPEAGENWVRLLRADTQTRLANLDWNTRWPVVWPKYSAAAGAAVLLLSALLAVRLGVLPPSAPVADSGPNEKAALVEELLADWEKAAELTRDPELRELLAELQPLRDELPKMNEREMFLALSKLENKLEALRDAAARDSLESVAGDMASAVENSEGLGPLADALRRRELERAAELAEKAAEKLARKGAEVPAGADSAATRQKMARAAEKLSESGQESAASAIQQTGEGARRKDPSQMAQGMKQLAQSLAKAAQSQSAKARLGLQLAQLGQCKNGMGNEEGAGLSLTVKLSEQKGQGRGAGSEIDPDREKDPTHLASERSLEGLAGLAGEGESEVETLSSETPGSEAPREERNAQFAKYEKLSQQAIADENLPPAYREAIRKYFEAIRPAAGPVDP